MVRELTLLPAFNSVAPRPISLIASIMAFSAIFFVGAVEIEEKRRERGKMKEAEKQEKVSFLFYSQD